MERSLCRRLPLWSIRSTSSSTSSFTSRSTSNSTTMSRPLPLLLALSALLALLPASHSINCYRCLEPTLHSSSAQNPLMSSIETPVGATVPLCSKFSTDDDAAKLNCNSKYHSCAKGISMGKTVIRGCSPISVSEETCLTEDDQTMCLCTGDYCNSAGLTTPGDGLLLPSALLAVLYYRQ